MCAEFAASRVPVREALRVLAEQGLVDKVPNQGCYVKQPDVDGIARFRAFAREPEHS